MCRWICYFVALRRRDGSLQIDVNHGVAIVLARSEDEARGKLHVTASRKFSAADGWSMTCVCQLESSVSTVDDPATFGFVDGGPTDTVTLRGVS